MHVHNMVSAAFVLVPTTLLPAAPALALAPGLYNLNTHFGTLEQVCLQSNLSWSGTGSVPLSGGEWLTTKTNTNLFVTSTDSSIGNVSIVVNKAGVSATWTQWTPDLSFFNIVEPLTVVLVSGSCG